jgi:hypothetical protein
LQEVTNRAVDRYCEHLVATVRIEHPNDARELRSILDSARRKCDFSKLVDANGNVTARKRTRNKPLDLDAVIAP